MSVKLPFSQHFDKSRRILVDIHPSVQQCLVAVIIHRDTRYRDIVLVLAIRLDGKIIYRIGTHVNTIADAVTEMGLRVLLGDTDIDNFDPQLTEKAKEHTKKVFKLVEENYGERIQMSVAPHAIYTVSGELLQWLNDFSREHGLLMQMHVAETEGEVRDSVKNFGLSPVRYLYKLGLLSPRLIIAHGLHVDEDEIRMLADHNVKVVHNPASNMKLASGGKFKFAEMKRAGVTVGLGTDGCASSNNLDMIEVMRYATFLGKVWRHDPEALKADEMLEAATCAGAKMLGLKAGYIREGYLADLSLVDMHSAAFTPNFNERLRGRASFTCFMLRYSVTFAISEDFT